MKVRFVYARFQRHAQAHPELLDYVPCHEYLGPPSLGIACLAAVTPPSWELDFRDDRLEDVGLDDDLDLVAISCFTPAATRGLELADEFRARGKKVIMGGIFATMMPDVAGQHADAIVIGEGDGIWPDILADVEKGELKPLYRAEQPVDMENLPLPRTDLYMEKEGQVFSPDDYPVQLQRGCPLQCDACVLPVSMGKKMRFFPLERTLAEIEQLAERGKMASFTEDTSFFVGGAAHRKFGELMDALAERGGAKNISYVGISMPMLLVTQEDYYRRMKAGGVNMFYLVGGFDPITRQAFTGKNPKALQRAKDAIAKTMDHGIEPYTSFLVGNDDDDEGTFDRMLEFGNATGIKKAEFAIMTPYPGTPAWFRLNQEKRILHRDWSRYNDANVVFEPKQMSAERLLDGYLYLWKEFYESRQGLADVGEFERTVQF